MIIPEGYYLDVSIDTPFYQQQLEIAAENTEDTSDYIPKIIDYRIFFRIEGSFRVISFSRDCREAWLEENQKLRPLTFKGRRFL